MEFVGFALSAALAQILTNLDNLAVLLALMLPLGPARAVAGYALAQLLVLIAAMLVALGLADMTPAQVGYLGLIPVALGGYGLWRGGLPDEVAGPGGQKRAGYAGTVVIFLSLSLDSFAVMAPLLADSLPLFRLAVLSGAVLAVAALAGVALMVAQPARRWARRFERLGPWAMIAAGLYVFLDSGTDGL